MAKAEDVADTVATELADWLDRTSTAVAHAVLESSYRPRVVEPSRAEALAVWKPLLVNPDGSLNEAGKQSVVSRYGGSGYRAIAEGVARALRAEPDEPTPAPPEGYA